MLAGSKSLVAGVRAEDERDGEPATGLYLLPLGHLVYRSGLFPKALGLMLAIGCGGYLAGVAASYLAPDLQSGLATAFGMVGGLAELVFQIWPLVRGARESREPEARAAGAAVATAVS